MPTRIFRPGMRRCARQRIALALLFLFAGLAPAQEAKTDEPERPPETRRERIARKRRMIEQMAQREREELARKAAEKKKAEMAEKVKEEQAKQGQDGKETPEGAKEGEGEKGEAEKTAESTDTPSLMQSVGAVTAPNYVLLLSPLNQSVNVGKRFSTGIVFRTDQSQPVDRVDIRIVFPPLEVRPLEFFDYPLREFLAPDAPTSLTIDNGILRYTARLEKPFVALGEFAIGHVVWESLAPSTNIDLIVGTTSRAPGRGSALYCENRDLLHSPWMQGQSCINATVVATLPLEEVRGLRILGDKRNQELDYIVESDLPEERRLSLDILKPADPPQPGQEFVLDVMVHNPEGLAFNELRLAIQYDTSRVEVLDWDFMGWIKRGTNLFDAHAHQRFPFNIHNRNQVNAYRGQISYHMGTTFLRPMPSGSLCRIHCRALAPGAESAFSLFPATQTDKWFTDVRATGASVLKRPRSESPVADTGARQPATP